MKKMKSILTALLVFTMVFSVCTISFAATTEKEKKAVIVNKITDFAKQNNAELKILSEEETKNCILKFTHF